MKRFTIGILGLFVCVMIHAGPVDHKSSVSEVDLETQSLKLGCHASLLKAGSQELLCLKNDVIDEGLPTETRGCSIRHYSFSRQKFESFPSYLNDDQLVLSPLRCEAGGLDAVLNLPLSETESVENKLTDYFNSTEDLHTWRLDEAPAFKLLVEKLKAKIVHNRREKGSGLRPATPVPAAAPAFRPPKQELNKRSEVQVFYGSDRQYQSNKPARETFSELRNPNAQLTLGTVTVSIPANHKFGNLELPDVFTVNMTQDPDRYVVLKSVERTPPLQFWQQLQNRVHGSKKKELFVFVHGFNVSFEEAALRTAQMAYDLKFAGAPVFYSWPSETILRYSIAEKNVEWTLPHLTAFLKELTEKSGATEIHLVAHSMGNRALTNALSAMAQARSASAEPLFRNVILAAPDIDQKDFKRIEELIRSTTSAMTLYASNNDKALQISARIHKGSRLGQTGVHTLTSPLFDTIDASDVDVSFLGHSYYGDNASVVRDMGHLISDSLTVVQRPFLKAVQSISGSQYWKLLTN